MATSEESRAAYSACATKITELLAWAGDNLPYAFTSKAIMAGLHSALAVAQVGDDDKLLGKGQNMAGQSGMAAGVAVFDFGGLTAISRSADGQFRCDHCGRRTTNADDSGPCAWEGGMVGCFVVGKAHACSELCAQALRSGKQHKPSTVPPEGAA